MDHAGFDQISKDIGTILSRRRLLRAGALSTLGLGLGVVTTPQTSAKKGKQRKKTGDVNKLCKTQLAPCTELFTLACAGDAQCVALVRICCPRVATCDVDGFLTCLQTG